MNGPIIQVPFKGRLDQMNHTGHLSPDNLLQFWDDLNWEQRGYLSSQIADIDFEQLSELHAKSEATGCGIVDRATGPTKVVRSDSYFSSPEEFAQATDAGWNTLREVRVRDWGFLIQRDSSR
jgi:hypothetical protein